MGLSARRLLTTALWLLLLTVQERWCLREVSLRVPEAVRAGEALTLTCDFALEHQERLYSVKFYQGDTEFYRFLPGESPPTRVFALEGVKVDISQSNSTSVTLSDSHRDMTGYYKCEVSADAPLFHTAIKTAYVTIAEEPWFMPVLTAEKSKYSLGEKIKANCSSQGGYPLANLTWYINGQQVKHLSPARVTFDVVRGSKLEDMDTSVSRIVVDTTHELFQEGRLRMRCVATQYTLYRRSSELDIHEDTPQIAPVLGPTAPHNQESSLGQRVSSWKTFTLVFVTFILQIFADRKVFTLFR